MCLKFCNHQRPGRTKLLKSLYPIVHTVPGEEAESLDDDSGVDEEEVHLQEGEQGLGKTGENISKKLIYIKIILFFLRRPKMNWSS